MKIKPLPPLKSLVVFESAARHLSFTKAALELNVTQGAISRQVRHLEDFLGHPLFRRGNRGLQMSTVGSAYYQTVREALLIVSSSTGNLIQGRSDKKITVVTSSAMASFWLMPRLKYFKESHPYIDLRILVVESLSQIQVTDFDVAMFYCTAPPTELISTPLFSERVFPVCSPDYLEANPFISDPKMLNKGTLIELDTEEHWVGWIKWFDECELPNIDSNTRIINFNNYPLGIQAALTGNGIALAWGTLIDSYLESGLLVSPITHSLSTQSQFYLIERPEINRKNGANIFRDWLQQTV